MEQSGRRAPVWQPSDDDRYEYQPLRLDPSVSRSLATTMLSLRAEFSGWELARVLKYADGTRRIWLRRRKVPGVVLPDFTM